MEAPDLVSPQLGRAFTIDRSKGDLGFVVRSSTLTAPTESIASRRVQHDSFQYEEPRHLAVVDGNLWIVTSLGYIEKLTADLRPLSVQRTRWIAEPGAHSADGRRVLVQHNDKYEVVDLTDDSKREVIDLLPADEIDDEHFALSASGDHVAVARSGRYDSFHVFSVGPQGAARGLVPTMPHQVLSVALSPDARHVLVSCGNQQANLAKVLWLSVEDWEEHESHVFDPKSDGWVSSPPATLWAEFLDDERAVLVGRAHARVVRVSDGVSLREMSVHGAAVAIVREGDRSLLWTRTEAGFEALDLE